MSLIRKTRFLLTSLGVVLALLFVTNSKSTHASSGLSVNPGYIVLSLTDKQPEQDVAIGVKNNYSLPVNITVSFLGLDQQQAVIAPTLYPDQSLKNALTITPSEFILGPNQSINVKLHIKSSNQLPPGGHYASLVLKQSSNSASGQIGLNSAVSVTMFVVKEGGAVRQLNVAAISASRSIVSTPKFIDINFENTGNVHVVPRARIDIINSSGKTIYWKGIVNDGSIPLLPNANIRLRTSLTELKPIWLPGRYKVRITYRYDGANNVQVKYLNFWYIPIGYFGLLALILAALFYGRKKMSRQNIRNKLKKLVIRPSQIVEKLEFITDEKLQNNKVAKNTTKIKK